MAWQRQLQKLPKTASDLVAQLGLQSAYPAEKLQQQPDFPLRAPQSFLNKIQPGNPSDPLLQQILPLAKEKAQQAGFSTDPVGDLEAQKNPALLHKYHGRALLLLTGQCAIHCRYCFRQHYDYGQTQPTQIQQALAQIKADNSLREIILSGGDPLVLSNRRLAYYLEQLGEIKHLQRLRIHSRLPVVLPERIDSGLLHLLERSPLPVSLVIHANHAQEIDKQSQKALQALRQAGVWLFNQAVLLRGVNADIEAQMALAEALAKAQVVPYYLHLLDKVQGAAHFEVTETEALALMQALQQRLPGYLVPKLVKEIAGLPYKQRVL